MEIKQIQMEIIEAERLIERNKIILQLHSDLQAANTKITELEAKDGN